MQQEIINMKQTKSVKNYTILQKRMQESVRW